MGKDDATILAEGTQCSDSVSACGPRAISGEILPIYGRVEEGAWNADLFFIDESLPGFGENGLDWIPTIESHRLPDVLNSLCDRIEAQSRQIERFGEVVSRLVFAKNEGDQWLDAKNAAQYLSLSASTFDKYRYSTDVKIPGHALDGKILYKKSDLDSFVRLYDVKSRGIA